MSYHRSSSHPFADPLPGSSPRAPLRSAPLFPLTDAPTALARTSPDGSPAVSRPAVIARLRAAGCVFAEDETELLIATARTPAELAVMVERRALGLPLEHVLGWAEFSGLRVAVDPGVFVPRRRTEFLPSA